MAPTPRTHRRLRLAVAGAAVLTALTTATAAASPPTPMGVSRRRASQLDPGLLLDHGRYTTLEVPGATVETAPLGITTAARSSAGPVAAASRTAASCGTRAAVRHLPLPRRPVHPRPEAQRPRPAHRAVQQHHRRPQGWGGSGRVPGTRAAATPASRPGARTTTAVGINNHTQVVGQYQDANGRYHGYSGAAAVPDLDAPARSRPPFRHQRPRPIVGARLEAMGPSGFVLDQGRFSAFAPPGAVLTLPFDINNRGQIVGPTPLISPPRRPAGSCWPRAPRAPSPRSAFPARPAPWRWGSMTAARSPAPTTTPTPRPARRPPPHRRWPRWADHQRTTRDMRGDSVASPARTSLGRRLRLVVARGRDHRADHGHGRSRDCHPPTAGPRPPRPRMHHNRGGRQPPWVGSCTTRVARTTRVGSCTTRVGSCTTRVGSCTTRAGASYPPLLTRSPARRSPPTWGSTTTARSPAPTSTPLAPPTPTDTYDTGHGFVQDRRGHTTSFDAPGAPDHPAQRHQRRRPDHRGIRNSRRHGLGPRVHPRPARHHHHLRGPLRAAAQRLRHQQPRPDRGLLRRARLRRGRRLPTRPRRHHQHPSPTQAPPTPWSTASTTAATQWVPTWSPARHPTPTAPSPRARSTALCSDTERFTALTSPERSIPRPLGSTTAARSPAATATPRSDSAASCGTDTVCQTLDTPGGNIAYGINDRGEIVLPDPRAARLLPVAT